MELRRLGLVGLRGCLIAQATPKSCDGRENFS